ncbi:MAG: tRNA dihydrouridine synthase DusB [Spirochaetia bacterium]|nr:tRNA dihydrouridine synthase DusB [Spirochaetia bacterium]
MNLPEHIRKFPYVLAPLAGYTDHAFRLICREYGASLTYTEMVSEYTIATPRLKPRMVKITHFTEAERPVGIQLFGNRPEMFHDAAKACEEMGFDLIDINFGCPVRRVAGSGSGSSLLLDLPLAAKIVENTVRAVKIPVSIKIRSGWDSEKQVFLDFNKMAEDYGVSIITLHPRTRAQMFKGRSNWEHIRILKQKSKLFVIGNGDVTSRDEALRMQKETGCDAVMIGRAAIGNPFLFKQIAEPGYEPTVRERLQTAKRHFELLYSFKEMHGLFEARKYFNKYIKGFDRAADLRKKLMTIEDREEIIKVLDSLPEMQEPIK